MITRLLPILLIVFPILGFFLSPDDLGQNSNPTGIHKLVYTLVAMPWYFKVLSILIGIGWLSIGGSNSKDEEA